MSKTQSLTQQLKRLPNSWVFGALWVAALLTMATAAAQTDERVDALLETIASLAAPSD